MISFSTMNNQTDGLNGAEKFLVFERPCPLCGSLNQGTVVQHDEFQFFTDSQATCKRAKVRHVQCRDCHALFMNPVYTSYGFRILFAEAGQSYGSTEIRPAEQQNWLKERQLLSPGSCVFDVGCYEGDFLAQLPHDVNKVGLDFDEAAIQRGLKRHPDSNMKLISGDMTNFSLPVTPDLITMFHVLEHLPDPVQTMLSLRRNARRETHLLVEVPILQLGKTNDINGFFGVQHLTHFSRSSLERIFSLTGWQIVEWCEQTDYNGCRVLAVPGAPRPREFTAAADRRDLYEVLSTWYASLADAEAVLSKLNEQEVVIWGAGMHTEFLYQVTSLFSNFPHRRYLLVDSDPLKQGQRWRGIGIQSPNMLKEIDFSNRQLLISSYGSQEKIAELGASLGVPHDRIVKLYKSLRIY